jgi:hypothetical protein
MENKAPQWGERVSPRAARSLIGETRCGFEPFLADCRAFEISCFNANFL